MTIPAQPDVELPLLLELERAGGRAQPGDLYSRIATHFPDMTKEDLRLTRESTGVNLWENTVHWARNALREKGHLNGGERGIWEITELGRKRLRADLNAFGLSEKEVEDLIKSSHTLPYRLGEKWQPRELRPRSLKVYKPRPSREPKRQPVELGVETVEIRDFPNRVLERLRSLSPGQFEDFVARLMTVLGLVDVRITGRSHDGGVDGDCQVPILDLSVAFQAKRYAAENQVGVQSLSDFRGRIVGRYDRGVFVTTSAFTPGAKELAEQPPIKIILIDGEDIVNIMFDKGLGIRNVPIVRTELDESFFENLQT